MPDVLFTPYVTIHVTDQGVVTGASVDWSDTLRNVTHGFATWDADPFPPTAPHAAHVAAASACTHLDDPAVRDAVAAALAPSRPSPDPNGRPRLWSRWAALRTVAYVAVVAALLIWVGVVHWAA